MLLDLLAIAAVVVLYAIFFPARAPFYDVVTEPITDNVGRHGRPALGNVYRLRLVHRKGC
jgi:hypothetical protein